MKGLEPSTFCMDRSLLFAVVRRSGDSTLAHNGDHHLGIRPLESPRDVLASTRAHMRELRA
jgi:hypothetical protein